MPKYNQLIDRATQIDGKELAEYMYSFGLEMQIEQTIEIKKRDADFWDSMKDEE